jgi:hypothetical protein
MLLIARPKIAGFNVTILTGSEKPSSRRSTILPRMLSMPSPRIGGKYVIILMGSAKPSSRRSVFLLVNRRHPRALARIRPTQLGLWSFAVAIAHGAGLMLVPIYLGLCRATDLDKGHGAAGALINANLGMAVLVSGVHSVAMIAAGGFLAWLVYRYLGLKFVSQSWFNLDATWASSLVLVGALSLVITLASWT